MGTVNSREIVDTIIANDGYYPGGPRVIKIVQYENQWNRGIAYGLVYETDWRIGQYNKYEESAACLNPQVIWEV